VFILSESHYACARSRARVWATEQARQHCATCVCAGCVRLQPHVHAGHRAHITRAAQPATKASPAQRLSDL